MTSHFGALYHLTELYENQESQLQYIIIILRLHSKIIMARDEAPYCIDTALVHKKKYNRAALLK